MRQFKNGDIVLFGADETYSAEVRALSGQKVKVRSYSKTRDTYEVDPLEGKLASPYECFEASPSDLMEIQEL